MDEFWRWFSEEYEGMLAVEAPFSSSELQGAFNAALALGEARGRVKGLWEAAEIADKFVCSDCEHPGSSCDHAADSIRQAAAQPVVQEVDNG